MHIKIGNKLVGDNQPVFIVAELSANHNQDLEIALKTIKAAKDAGADAIKFQTYTADTITMDADNKHFQIDQGTVWDGKTLHKLYEEAYTPWEWHPKLKQEAIKMGLIWFSSPFDNSAVDLLHKLDTPCYKIASFEITDIPLIEYVAKKGKPIIISTGIATLEDITEAIEACRKAGNNQVAILKCTSAYPADPGDMNLATIPEIATRFGVIAGLSDHSLGITAPVVAVSFGAKIIEKHLILDRNIGGPDAGFSLEPNEFADMVKAVRIAEKAIGKATFELSAKALKNREFSRSLFVVKDIKKGEKFTEENVRSIRPGFGLPPKMLNDILGKSAMQDIAKGTPLSMSLINTDS